MKDSIQFIIPVAISIIAVGFNGWQLFISNKQFLFEKRLHLYRRYKMLIEHQERVKIYLNGGPEDFLSHEMLITDLVNDSELASMCNGWTSEAIILEGDNHKSFLTMIEKLRICGEESSFVFGKYGFELCQYFNKYADLCNKTYQYRILRKDMDEENKKNREFGQAMPLEVVLERQKPLHEGLIQTYKELCKISESIQLEKLAKEISLSLIRIG